MGGHHVLPVGLKGTWGSDGLELSAAALALGQDQLSWGFFLMWFLPLSWSWLFCSSWPVQMLSCGPILLGFWHEGGLGIWHPCFLLAGGAVGQHPGGQGCHQSVFVLWLLSGATGSCFKSGTCEDGAAWAGAMPRSFTAPASGSGAELKNKQSLPHSPHPPAGSQVPPCDCPSVFGSPVAAAWSPALGVLRKAWHDPGANMCCW